MRATGLLILVAATAIAVAAVNLQLREEEQASVAASASSGALFPDLLDRANEVAEVSITTADETVTLKNQDGQWVLLERGAFPAEFGTIQGAVVGLGRLTIVEPKTSKPEYHDKLGVAEPDADGSSSKRVELRDGSGATICSAVLGNTDWRGGDQMVYARRGDEDQVYLCKGRLDVNPSPTSWIPREIIRLDRDRVEAVEIRHADGELVSIVREGENSYLVDNLPEGREEKSPGIANSVGSALAYLSLEDVQPASTVDFESDPVAETTYRCEDGLVVVATTARDADKIWLQLNASYEEPAEAAGPVAPAEPGEPTESSAEGEGDTEGASENEPAAEEVDEGPDPEAVRAEAEELAERLDGWAFAIPQYKLDVIARTMEDLMAPLEDPAAPAEPAPFPIPGENDPEQPPMSLEELLGPEKAAEILQQMEEQAPESPASGGEGTQEATEESEAGAGRAR